MDNNKKLLLQLSNDNNNNLAIMSNVVGRFKKTVKTRGEIFYIPDLKATCSQLRNNACPQHKTQGD